MKEPFLVGVDVGGTNLRVGVLLGHNLVWSTRRHAGFSEICQKLAAPEALDAVIGNLAGAIEEARVRYPEVQGVGIGFPGFIAPDTRVVHLSPNLPGLLNADLISPLSARLGLPVILENDALAAAYGEYLLLQPRSDSLLYLGLGTGVGGGLILHGQPYSGEHGVAMELGHLIVDPGGRLCGCGNRGCLEQYASAVGIALNYAAMGQVRLDAEAIASLAHQGDSQALKAFEEAAMYLAAALAHVLKIVDISEVVIGGGLSRSWSLMEPVFLAHLDGMLIPVLRGRIQVRLSQGEDHAGMLGAAALAWIQTNASVASRSE
jgi:glucokinase